ncbi:MAG TPA: protein phosphatase CheZ [Pseudolabrys sp.]|nr:protein phosphatase CheZ [Pseudolabrys sp.]
MQRKVFRVEQMIGARRARGVAQPPQIDQPAVSETTAATEARVAAQDELAALRDIVARNARTLMALINDGKDRRMARAAGELAAAVESMETATQKVLASVESVDDCARVLVSALTDDYHHGLAQDIQDHVVRVYEACNFQDLAGQRIGKVIATLVMVEEQLSAVIENCHNVAGAARRDGAAGPQPSGHLLNGPRLDGAGGHASQQDIDLMFA